MLLVSLLLEADVANVTIGRLHRATCLLGRASDSTATCTLPDALTSVDMALDKPLENDLALVFVIHCLESLMEVAGEQQAWS